MVTSEAAKPQGSDEHRIEPIDMARLRSLLTGSGVSWPLPRVVPTTGSTNDDIAVLASQGSPEGTCVVADEQTAGRGRLDRTWVSPPGGGLWMSVLLRPGAVAPERLSWLPLLAGVAATDALREACGVNAELKWPNDIVAIAAACGGSDGPRKMGGVLSAVLPDSDAAEPAVVLGIGINVSLRSAELPVRQATSVLLEGGRPDRTALLASMIASLENRVAQWRAGDGSLAADYRARCATIGRWVEVRLPGEREVSGVVSGIDDDGHLLIAEGESSLRVTAGDVIHATI